MISHDDWLVSHLQSTFSPGEPIGSPSTKSAKSRPVAKSLLWKLVAAPPGDISMGCFSLG